MSEIEKRKEVIMRLREQIFTILDTYACTTYTTKRHATDCLTEADTQIERLLRQTIETEFPDDSIVGEEEMAKQGTSSFTWHIDPVDGTHPFTRGIKEYGTSVGMTENDEPVLGIILFSEDRKAYWAIKGQGAFADDEPIRVKERPLEQCSLAFQLSEVPEHITKISKMLTLRPMGEFYSRYAAVWYFVNLARGSIDGILFFMYGGAYDVCAGVVIAKEAGAIISEDLWNLKNTGKLFAGTPKMYAHMEKKINE